MPSAQRCPQCDYVLTGLPDEHHCPECGMPFDPSMVVIEKSPEKVYQVILAGVALAGMVCLGILAGFPVKSGLLGAFLLPILIFGEWRQMRRRRNRAVVSKSEIRLISWERGFNRSFRWDQIATVELTDLWFTRIRSPAGEILCDVPLRHFDDRRQARRFVEECTRRLAGGADKTPP
jgi:hypothetical protein